MNPPSGLDVFMLADHDSVNKFTSATGLLAMGGGLVVLVGWTMDIAQLKSISSGWVSMKVNTAAGFILLGFALRCFNSAEKNAALRVGRIVASLAALIGLLTIIEYASGQDFGIDQWLFSEPAGTVGTSSPGRMAPDTALSFLLLGLALAIKSTARVVMLAAAAAGLLVAVFSLAAVLSYLATSLGTHGWFGYTVMAMHTALLFVLLGLAVAARNWQKCALHWALSKPVMLAFACGLVWLALIGLNTTRSQLWLKDANAQIVNNELQLRDLQGILIAAIDAQTHARGYVITGEERFKENYLDAQAESQQRLEVLRRHVFGNLQHQQHVDQIEKLILINLDWLKRSIEAERSHAATRNQMLAHGEQLLNTLRAEVTGSEASHQQKIDQLKQESARVSHYSNLFIVSGTLASLLIFLIALLRLNLSEAKNHRLSNLYAALSQCNQAIVRCTSAEELFPQLCRDVVKFGGMKMAWIGSLDEAEHRVVPVASFGEGVSYLEGKQISVDADDPAGRGPTGTAMRDNQPYWCQDFKRDPATLPWRARAAQYGWASSAALPLQCEGRVVGALTVYSSDTGAFDEAARNLLVEMAMDISFALNSFSAEAARRKLESSLDEKQALVEIAGRIGRIGGWTVDLPDLRLVWSDEVCRIHEVPAGTHPSVEQAIAYYAPGSQDKISAAVDACIKRGTSYDLQLQIITAKNQHRWVRAIGQPVYDDGGTIIRIQGAFQDISEQKVAEAEKLASEVRYQLLFDSMVSGFALHEIICDEQGRPVDYRFLEVNPAFEALTGLKAADVIGRSALDVLPGLEHSWIDRYGAVALSGKTVQFEHFTEALGKYFEVIAYSPKFGQFVTLFTDITERKQAEERIQRLANFDHLTGLPNRAQLNDRTHFAISLAQRNHESVCLMFLDLDRFKNINDTMGHATGDELLLQVSARLKSLMRDEDTVSRMGGDEFVLLLPDTDTLGAAKVAGKLLEFFARPYLVGEHEIIVSPSIGIAIYPDDGVDFETLSKSADIAMYRAKQAGRNGFCFFAAEMQEDTARVLLLSTALRLALQQGQLQLHYQPQLSLTDGHVIGAEALLRWQHPELGAISPAEFIPIAEDGGQIMQIGEWVLHTALHQLKCWIDGGMAPMVIAVNLSAIQFGHANLPALISRILEETGLSPEYLELELTEGVAMENPVAAIATMDDLHRRGVRMSIDDFGTGYSSLSYLKRFQVYKLKIDQSFVRDIADDAEDKAIVAAIISMAGSLGMQTIAEGVETAEQLEFLRSQGCDEVQGYYFSRPLPAAQFEAYVRDKILSSQDL